MDTNLFKFQCPFCEKKMLCDHNEIDQSMACPYCNNEVVITYEQPIIKQDIQTVIEQKEIVDQIVEQPVEDTKQFNFNYNIKLFNNLLSMSPLLSLIASSSICEYVINDNNIKLEFFLWIVITILLNTILVILEKYTFKPLKFIKNEGLNWLTFVYLYQRSKYLNLSQSVLFVYCFIYLLTFILFPLFITFTILRII